MRAPCTFGMSVSPKPLPHRTSTFRRIRRSNLAELPHFRSLYFWVTFRQHSAVRDPFDLPRCLGPLPKPGCRHPDSATKPDMNVSVHPAPQQRGACHAYLSNQSPWLFSYRDNVDVTVGDCLSHRSLLAFWAGCDRLRCCHHP